MDAFPAIKVDETGISVKNLFSIDHFAWDEVKEVTRARNLFRGTKVLTLAPHGNPLANFIKFYPYFIHGQLAGVSLEPAILLSTGLPDREQILKEIGKHVLEEMLKRPSISNL